MKQEIVIENERVFLKKDWLGWRVIEPAIIDGKLCWKNIFNKRGFVMLGFILFLLFTIYMAVGEQIENYKTVMDNPCAYCKDCQDYGRTLIQQTYANYSSSKYGTINFSLIKFDETS